MARSMDECRILEGVRRKKKNLWGGQVRTAREGSYIVDLDYHYSLLGSSTCLALAIFIGVRDILVIWRFFIFIFHFIILLLDR